MACLTDERVQEYLEGGLTAIEAARVRDHLLTCTACQALARRYQKLNTQLQFPALREPPETIIQNVMRRLYPEFPLASSIAALIAASFLFLVSWIYIYFDFDHNSLVKALQLTSQRTSTWLSGTIKVISAVFSVTYGSFKAINAFLRAFLKINLGTEIVAGLFLTLSLLFFYSLIHFYGRKLKARKK